MVPIIKNPLLHRYWFEFDVPPPRPAPGTLDGDDAFEVRACGVTAFSMDDAFELLRERVFVGARMPPVLRMIEDPDLSDVELFGAVPIWRGVWSCRPAPRPPRRIAVESP